MIDVLEKSEEISFPSGATNEEREMKWEKIAEIFDRDLGFNNPKEKTDMARFCVRVVIRDGEKILVIKSEKHGYTQIPGGGIEDGESMIEALRRETREETGYTIKDIEPLGYIVEHREDVQNVHPYDKSISFVFKASIDKKVGTSYAQDEIEEGFVPIWIGLDELIVEKTQAEGSIDDYSGCFSNKRDLEIARYCKAIK